MLSQKIRQIVPFDCLGKSNETLLRSGKLAIIAVAMVVMMVVIVIVIVIVVVMMMMRGVGEGFDFEVGEMSRQGFGA